MAASVQRALEIAHVCILLGVDPWVWEKDWQVLDVELHLEDVVGLMAASLRLDQASLRMTPVNCTRLCVC